MQNAATLTIGTTNFIIGDAGTGTVLLRDTSQTSVAQNMIIGSQSGSSGGVTERDDAGLIVTGQLRVGDSGTGSFTSLGTVTLAGGALASHMDVGTFSGGVGTVDLSNAGGVANLTIIGNSSVGTSGTGTLTVHDGGFMYSDGLSIGTNSDGNGTVIIKGENAGGTVISTIIVQNNNNLDVGAAGTGDLELRQGGAASAENIHVGRDAGSGGTLLVQGLSPVTNTAATLTATNDLSIGGTQVGPGGQGTVTVKNNGVVNVTNNMWVWGGGTGTGGTLEMDNTAVLTVGGTLTFDGGLLHFLGGGVTFANNVTFGNTQSPDGMIAQVDNAHTATMTGILSGPGGLTKTGTGTLVLQGTAPNTYTGTTTVELGTLALNAADGTIMVPGDVVIGLGTGGPNAAILRLQNNNQIATTSNMTINSDGQYDMNGFGNSIHNLEISQGNVINVPTDGLHSLALFGTLNMTGGSISGGTGATPGLLLAGANSDVTATSDAAGNAAVIASNVTLNFLGTITRTFTVNDGPGAVDLSITGVIQDQLGGGSTGAGLIKEGAGTLEFASATGNTYTGTTHVNDGVLSLNGPAGTDQIPDNLVIGDGNGGAQSAVVVLQNHSQIANSANVTIKRDGLFDMNGFGETINNLVINRGDVTNVPTSGGNSLALNGTLDMTGGSITGGLGATPGLLLLGANSDVTATSDAAGNAALIASNIDLGGVTRTFTVNDGPGSVDLEASGVIQDGGLTKEGAGLMLLTGASTYTGDTTINDGVLQLDGSIASAETTVNLGGTLSGIGTVGGNLTNNGTVSPGDSPGTLTVNGNYTQNASGNLIIEIASLATHDLLQMGGAANLDGTLTIVKLANFSVVAGDKIIFLTAAGGVNNEFATVVTDFGPTGTLISPEVIYEPNDVALLFAQGSFVIGGLTPNQTSVAVNLNNSVGDARADALINFLDTEPLANLPHDYDLIAPEELAALYEISFSKAIVQNMNIQHRTDDIRAGSTGFSSNGMNMTTSGPVLPDPGLTFAYSDGKVVLPVDNKDKNVMVATPENRWGVFVTGSGDFVNVDNNDRNAHGYDITTGTVLVGLDYRVCDHFAIGIDGSYSGGRADLVDDGRINYDGGQAGAYATVYGIKGFFGSLIHIDGGVNGGWNDYDTHRTGLQNLPVRGSTDGSEFNAFLAYGSDWHFGRLLVGTWSSLQYTNVDVNSFTETGSLAPLTFPDQSEDSFRSSTGLRLAYDASFGRTIFRPEIRAAWEHEYGDRAYPIDARFASGAGGIFTVHGPAIGRDSALVDAGFTILWNNRVSTYLFYDGNLGRSNYDNNAVSGGLRLTF